MKDTASKAGCEVDEVVFYLFFWRGCPAATAVMQLSFFVTIFFALMAILLDGHLTDSF